jgi:hypothetical protein
MTYHERFAPSNEAPEIPLIDKFAECCDFQRWFVDEGWVSKQVAVDNMQNLAENWGLVDSHGQDAVQAEMAAAFRVVDEEIPLAPEPEPAPRTYHTPQSTIDAFWWVARNEDTEYLARWLRQHPRDAANLHDLWKTKCPQM